MSYRDSFKPLHEKAPQIAVALGEGWGYVPPENGELPWFVILRKGMPRTEHYPGLHMGLDGNRIKISGQWPRDKSGQMHSPFETPSITVSLDREPEAIAKDIQRRFLSTYLPMFEEYRSRSESANDAIDRKEAVLELIAGDLGLTVKRNEHTGHVESSTLYPRGPVYTIRVNHNGETADLDIRALPIEKTRALLRILDNDGAPPRDA